VPAVILFACGCRSESYLGNLGLKAGYEISDLRSFVRAVPLGGRVGRASRPSRKEKTGETPVPLIGPDCQSFLAVPHRPCGGPHLSKKHFLPFRGHADTPTPPYADTSLSPQTTMFLNSSARACSECRLGAPATDCTVAVL
jgi:hypothetical protein